MEINKEEGIKAAAVLYKIYEIEKSQKEIEEIWENLSVSNRCCILLAYQTLCCGVRYV